MMASFGDVFVDPLSSGLFPAVFEFREYPSAGCVLGHEQRFGQVASFGDAPGKIRNLDSIAATAVSEWDENYRIRKLHLVFLLMRSS